jgi:hypothetical protein
VTTASITCEQEVSLFIYLSTSTTSLMSTPTLNLMSNPTLNSVFLMINRLCDEEDTELETIIRSAILFFKQRSDQQEEAEDFDDDHAPAGIEGTTVKSVDESGRIRWVSQASLYPTFHDIMKQ